MNIRTKIFGAKDAGEEQPLLDSKRPKGAKADMLHSIAVSREESRRGNTRAEDRHRLPEEEATVTYKGKSYRVQLINVSGGGAMVTGEFEPMLWDRVDLHLGDDGVIECAVRWLKADRIGLEFAHETRLDCSRDDQAALLREVVTQNFSEVEFEETDRPAPDDTSDNQRGERRHPLIWSGTLHHDFQSIPVRLRNISARGALIDCPAAIRVGAEPLLDLGQAGQNFATVAWVVGDQVGLKFQKNFDISQLAKSRPQVASGHSHTPAYLQADASATEQEWGHMSLSELREELEGFMKR